MRLRSEKFYLLLVLVVVLLLAGKLFHFEEDSFKAFFSQFPILFSSVVYVVSYVVLTSLIWLGPKDIFRIVGAVIYGPYLSTLLIWIAEMFNVTISFHLSRHLGREYVDRKLSGEWKKFDQWIVESGFVSLFLLRVIFVVPFRFLDMSIGLSKITFKKYLLIAFLGTPLRVFIFQFILSFGVDVIRNPVLLAEKLIENKVMWVVSLTYFFASLMIILILRAKARIKNKSTNGLRGESYG